MGPWKRFVSLSGVLAFAALGASAACNSGAASLAATPPANVVTLSAENLTTATAGEISAGPTISGQLTPARKATVRAEVGGSIIALPVDRGQRVTSGSVIAKISSRDLDVAYESSGAAVKSAETALAVARSEVQRTETLVKGGALAARDLEQAQNAAANAEAALAAARARQRSTWQALDDTSVKAPFSGIVSERPASLGDNVTPGTELLTIIDPSSMRLEALVPSDQIQQIRPGATARFTIRGAAGEFTGTVDRVSPSADPATRQVSIFISLPNSGGKLIAGLYAEGQVDVTTRTGIVVPLAAIDETGPIPMATRIRSNKAERVSVTLGPRRTDTEEVEVASGVTAGDVLVRGSAKSIATGTPVNVVK
jgi:RND family efflux transporter MFP subunit